MSHRFENTLGAVAHSDQPTGTTNSKTAINGSVGLREILKASDSSTN
jgi:hypothetical protein